MTSRPAGRSRAVAAAWDAERRLLEPAVRAEPSAVDELLAPEFHEIGQSGTHWTRQEILSVVTSDDAGDAAPVIDEEKAEIVAPGVVLLTYRLEFGGGVSRRSSIWRIRPEGPLMVFHQGTLAH